MVVVVVVEVVVVVVQLRTRHTRVTFLAQQRCMGRGAPRAYDWGYSSPGCSFRPPALEKASNLGTRERSARAAGETGARSARLRRCKKVLSPAEQWLRVAEQVVLAVAPPLAAKHLD